MCDGIDSMDNIHVDETKIIIWVVVCVTVFWYILVIVQIHNTFDLQPASNIYADWYLFIKTRPVIFPSDIQCAIASSYHPVTDDNTIKLDQLVNCWDFKVIAVGA